MCARWTEKHVKSTKERSRLFHERRILWLDMAIVTSYTMFGHRSSSGLVGQEMKPETMKT